jgi:hypothetical protein
MRRETLNLAVDREFVQRLLTTGRAFDLERGGLYDARSGVINIWCSPDDKPACWNSPISRGALTHPRSYAGALGWDWRDDDQSDLYVEAAPYDLLERQPRQPLAERSWKEILAWLREKALDLVRLARLEPRVVGTCCPFCAFVLPAGELLNDLIDHITAQHASVSVREFSLATVRSSRRTRETSSSGRPSSSMRQMGGD